jgi:hypothetical protein
MADLDETNRTPPPAPAGGPNASSESERIDAALPRLRTFADDLSDEIKKKGTTTASIVQAERERAAREIAFEEVSEKKESPWRNPLLLGIALTLIIGGALVMGGAYVYSTFVAPPVVTEAPSIIFPNKIKAIDVPDFRPLSDALLVERTESSLPLGEVVRIDPRFIQATTSTETILEQFAVPAGLLREAQSVMVGVHSFDRNQPFLIIEVTQYDRAYGAMLEWEEDMGRGLGAFFAPPAGKVPPTMTFSDKVFQNIDTRVSQSEWPLLYAFPRKDVLVITTNQYTLQEIMTRLNAQTTTSVR